VLNVRTDLLAANADFTGNLLNIFLRLLRTLAARPNITTRGAHLGIIVL
jgi:hypothetical protein